MSDHVFHLNNHSERELTDREELYSILHKGKYSIISMCRDNEPYIVTLSYGYDKRGNRLYFHAASGGMKIEILKANDRVCGTIIEDGGYLYGECAHQFRSVVFRGTMQVVEDLEEMKYGMEILVRHQEYDKNVIDEKLKKSEAFYSKKMTVLKVNIEQVTGKAGK